MLDERRMLITGAAGGIGRATAVKAAAQNASHVAVVDIDDQRLDTTAKAVRSAGAECLALSIDLRESEQIALMVQTAAEWAGGLDVLINNAGVFDATFTSPDRTGLENLPEPAWAAVYDVNVTAAWLAMKHAAPHLRASDRTPAVVNVASIAALTGYREPAYTSSKGALVQLTRSAAVNLAPDVRVNCVCPGVVRTPMTESHGKDRQVAHRGNLIPRLGEPDELANVITFLAGREATYMTGAVVPVDGGTTAWRGWHE